MKFLTILLGPIVFFAAFAAVGQQRPNDCRIDVGKNVMITGAELNEGRRIRETYIAVNPRNKNNLIAGTISVTGRLSAGDAYTVFYSSLDAGKTWKKSELKDFDGKPTKGLESGDPLVIFDKSGRAYFVLLADPGVVVYISDDGGRNVGLPSFVTSPPFDHPMPAADLTDGPYAGSVYLFGPMWDVSRQYGSRLTVLRTRTRGRDWTKLELLNGKASGLAKPGLPFNQLRFQSHANGLLISDIGKLFFVTKLRSGLEDHDLPDDGPKESYILQTSVDGGKTFSKATPLLAADGSSLITIRRIATGPGFGIDASGGRFNNRLYVAWMEKPVNDKHWRMVFSSSSDEGKTWTQARELEGWRSVSSLDSSLLRQSNPVITVNKKGVLLLTFFAFDATGKFSGPTETGHIERSVTHRRYAMASLDGGATFLPPVPIAAVPSAFISEILEIDFKERERAEPSEHPRMDTADLQDYQNDVAGPDGIFHTQWMDSRTKGTQQMWYAPVNVKCGGGPQG